MPRVPRTYSAAEIAAEAGWTEDRVRWLSKIGLLTPDEHGRFTFGAVLAVKMVSALMDSGTSAQTIEHAASEGLLSFQRTDEYLPYEPGPRSERTFAEFQAEAGPRAELLPAVYEGKSMAGLIDLVTSGEIPKDSTVLYAHLGGQPALNAYAGIFD